MYSYIVCKNIFLNKKFLINISDLSNNDTSDDSFLSDIPLACPEGQQNILIAGTRTEYCEACPVGYGTPESALILNPGVTVPGCVPCPVGYYSSDATIE